MAQRLRLLTGPGRTEPSGSTSAVRRMPFGPVDEAVYLLDSEAEPWSVQLELRVTGRLDGTGLARALGRALDAHPMARARKAPSRRSGRQLHWEIPDEPDVGALRVVECPDDAALAAARADLQSTPLSLSGSPPLRLRLAHHPDGDVLMLNAHHAAVDGFGALRLFHSVARAYTGTADPPPAAAPEEAVAGLSARLAGADGRTRARRHRALVEKLGDLLAPPARIAPEGQRHEPGYGFQHLSLPQSLTRSLTGLDHPGTVNDVLLAALHLAIDRWNRDHGKPCGRVGVLVPANLRPTEWRQDVVANFTLPSRIATRPRDRGSPRAALDAVTSATRRRKQHGLGTELAEVLRLSPGLPLWLKKALVKLVPATGNRLVDTAMLSNLGRLDDLPSFGPEAGATVEVWFSPPARMPMGLALGAATVAGRLHLSFRHRRSQFGPAGARRFAERYVAELERLVDDVGSVGRQGRVVRLPLRPVQVSPSAPPGRSPVSRRRPLGKTQRA